MWSPDIVGHGEGEPPEDLHAYRIQAAVAALAKDLPFKAAAVLGYSMGARLALAFALAHPKRVRALILIGGTAGIPDPNEAAARRVADEALAERIESKGIARFQADWERRPLIASQRRIAAPVLAAMAERRLRNSPRGLANSLRAMGTGAMASLWKDLPRLAARTLLLTGEHDTKFAAIARRMEEAIPNATRVVVPGAGHCAHLERPTFVAAAIKAFLRK